MVFVDGGYVRRKLQEEGLNWNWNISQFNVKIHQRFFPPPNTQGEEFIRLYYYDANYNKDDPLFDPFVEKKYDERKKIFDAFDNMGKVEVVLESLILSTKNKDRQKGVDTRIAIDMISKGYLDHYDIAILVCGDRDFIPIVKAVKNLAGKAVYGVYFQNKCPDDLVRIFDRRLIIPPGDNQRWGFPS
jgi:uncharacterized LabA/DUF88 family protein